MFLIARMHDGERFFWRGGMLWEVEVGPEAVRIMGETDAEATIDWFLKLGLPRPMFLVALKDVL
jgi:hypothetical protein